MMIDKNNLFQNIAFKRFKIILHFTRLRLFYL